MTLHLLPNCDAQSPLCWDEGTMFQSHLLPVIFCEGATMKTYLCCTGSVSRCRRCRPQTVR